MKFTKLERDKLLNSFLPMLDMSKTKKESYRELTKGANLIASGVTTWGMETIKPDKTYNAKKEREVVPDHKSAVIIMMDQARGQSDLEDKMAVYLIQWGLPQYYRLPDKIK